MSIAKNDNTSGSFILAAQRTPIGSFQGKLASVATPQLGAGAIRAALGKAQMDPQLIEEVYMGSVLTAGQGQAPARQAALGAGLGQHTPATTVGKVCGSGMKAIMLADLQIRAGDASAIIAGGMENMSQAPYLMPKARDGLRLGHGELVDSMIKDGLWDVYNNFHMGNATELCVKKFQLTRAEQDDYAIRSYELAQAAIQSGKFRDEITPVEVVGRKGNESVDSDEEPFRFEREKFLGLKPAFDKAGTVTAGNASTINDGAAALVLGSADFVSRHQLKPIARIVGQATSAEAPEWFTTAPSSSIQKLLKKTGKNISDIDLWEINEAFAAVALANQRVLEIPVDRINVNGGAVALGHPIGASGARIVVTLIHALQQQGKKRGVASLCIGGGEATSLMIELV